MSLSTYDPSSYNVINIAVIFPCKSYSQKFPHSTSLYAPELLAIKLALYYIGKYSSKTSIIFTDSRLCSTIPQNTPTNNPFYTASNLTSVPLYSSDKNNFLYTLLASLLNFILNFPA